MTSISNLRVFCFLIAATILMSPYCKFKPTDVNISFRHDRSIPEDDTVKKYRIPADNIGYIVYDMETNRVARSCNRKKTFIPASTTKVPTTVAALNILGPNFRFKTFLCYTGSIEKDTLKGDLYLKGTGDPLLTVADLMEMAEALRAKGIKSVSGQFYFDESDLASRGMIDNSMEVYESYNSGLSALSLEYNSIFAEWRPLKESGSMEIFLTPSLPINRARLSKKELRENVKFAYQVSRGSETWLLSQKIDKRGRERLPVKKPGKYTAYMFAKMCSIKGINIPDPKPGKLPSGYNELYVHSGLPLTEIIDLTLLYSINLMSELLILKTAKTLSGKVSGLEESAHAVSEYFFSKLRKIDWEGFLLVNGSGLTSRNRISPEQMLAILLYADAQEYNGRKYISYLPASGWEWSLLKRLNRPETAFHVWAKTGTINYSLALAGYLYTKSHKKMAFAFFTNDIELRKKYESDPDRRSKKSMRKVWGWLNYNRSAMDRIITDWIREM